MDEIERAIKELKEFENGNTYDTEYTDFNIFRLAIDALEKQLSDSWIPVSEKLPEKNRVDYLVTLYFNFISVKQYETYVCKFDDGNWYYLGENVSSRVIAWKSLPESYKKVK